MTAVDPTKATMTPVNILPPQYARPDTSGLEVEIVEGDNNVPPIDLGGTPDAPKAAKDGTRRTPKRAPSDLLRRPSADGAATKRRSVSVGAGRSLPAAGLVMIVPESERR